MQFPYRHLGRLLTGSRFDAYGTKGVSDDPNASLTIRYYERICVFWDARSRGHIMRYGHPAPHIQT
jgi:hypothetical protein